MIFEFLSAAYPKYHNAGSGFCSMTWTQRILDGQMKFQLALCRGLV